MDLCLYLGEKTFRIILSLFLFNKLHWKMDCYLSMRAIGSMNCLQKYNNGLSMYILSMVFCAMKM